jgi:hypothetical protein
MRNKYPAILAAAAFLALSVATDVARSDDTTAPAASGQPANSPAPATPAPVNPAPANPAPATPAPAPDIPPSVTILNTHEVQGIVGREVLSAANENMGRIVDVIVDGNGQVRAAIIDFGGFLGVGSRKIAVDWSALHFQPPDQAGARITLELTRDQVKSAPEYLEGKPVVILGALGRLEPLPLQ